MRKNVISRLEKMDACIDAIEWIKQYDTFDEAWANCDRSDWMLWLIGRRIKILKQRKVLVLCVCQCARLSLKYVQNGEKRPKIAIETAEKWANNAKGVTIQDVKNVSAAAASAANAASAASAAANAAASAASAASAAYAANAAASAAYAAASSAKKNILKKCAGIVKGFYPNYKF